MRHFINQFVPFILIGIAIVAFAFGIMLLAYLFLFGAMVGFILFIIDWTKKTFFPQKHLTKSSRQKGRVIDVDDWRKM